LLGFPEIAPESSGGRKDDVSVCCCGTGRSGLIQLISHASWRHPARPAPASDRRPGARRWEQILGLKAVPFGSLQPLANGLNVSRFFVMAGLVPAIHVFLVQTAPRRGCPAQGRA